MNNVINELSTLTSIPEKTLNKLVEKLIYVSCEDVLENVLDEKPTSELDLGFGILYIKHSEGEIKYKFIPSEAFEKAINDTVTKKLNLMEKKLSDTLSKKFIEVYKDIC